ncbi:hypothetical protein FOA52_007655 [Chlamydomonas sp. UWO 241]|nr:hypothetical protein FOA52_007655 [Chlamydomonas sp. UWO 241]
MLDVRDAVEACAHVISEKERCQCYLGYGLDRERVENYYPQVMRMERALEDHSNEDDLTAQRMVRTAGIMLLMFMGVRTMQYSVR